MPNLYVKCKKCGSSFASGISVDKKSFETTTLRGNYHTCPSCGATYQYDKADYFFKE